MDAWKSPNLFFIGLYKSRLIIDARLIASYIKIIDVEVNNKVQKKSVKF